MQSSYAVSLFYWILVSFMMCLPTFPTMLGIVGISSMVQHGGNFDSMALQRMQWESVHAATRSSIHISLCETEFEVI